MAKVPTLNYDIMIRIAALCFGGFPAIAFAQSDAASQAIINQKQMMQENSGTGMYRNNNNYNYNHSKNNDNGSAVEDAIGAMIIEGLRQHYQNKSDQLQKDRDDMQFGSKLVNTNGDWYVIGIAENEYLNVLSGPSTSGYEVRRLAILAPNTKGIQLAGQCINKMCPIKLNTYDNNGIGWVYGYSIERNVARNDAKMWRPKNDSGEPSNPDYGYKGK